LLNKVFIIIIIIIIITIVYIYYVILLYVKLVINVKTIKSLPISCVVQLFCNTTSISIHIYLLFLRVICLDMPRLCLTIYICMF